MTRIKLSGAGLMVALACLALSGAALAGNGNGSTPPGQENKEQAQAQSGPPAHAAPPAQQAQAAQAEKKEAKAAEKAAPKSAQTAPKPKPKPKKAAKPAPAQKAAKAQPAATQANAGKITICHKTGSGAYVQITISANGWNGHRNHGDLNPVPAGGCPAGAAGANANGNDTDNEHDKVLICHRTSSATNPYVIINIARAGWENGHSGHDGDKLIRAAQPGEKPTAADEAWAAANCASASGNATLNAAGTSTELTTSAGGVAGVQATLSTPKAAAKKPSGGVAGAVARIGRVASGNLPFTGLPLWIAVALAVGLVAAGAVALRAGRERA